VVRTSGIPVCPAMASTLLSVPDEPQHGKPLPEAPLSNVETSVEFVADDVVSSVDHVATEVTDSGQRLYRLLHDDIVSRDGYLIVLIMMIVTIIAIPIGDDLTWGQVLNAVVVALLVATTLSRSHVARRLRIFGAVVTVAAIGFAIAGALNGDHPASPAQLDPRWLYAVGAGLYTLVLAMCFPAILRQAFTHMKVDLNTVAASLSAYLLLGLIFTAAYRFIGIVNPPFFVQSGTNGFTYEYFSYVTLTTVGYGDFTAASDAGRAAAIIEALFGQVFLVTIVALVVSNLGRTRDPVVPLAESERRPLLRRRSSPK
jgi:voltage-gated potassium channel Kch